MEIFTGLVQEGGRVVIPASVRKDYLLEAGKEIIWVVDDGKVSVLSRKKALEEARKYFQDNKTFNGSIVDELIADRRKEAAKEMADE